MYEDIPHIGTAQNITPFTHQHSGHPQPSTLFPVPGLLATPTKKHHHDRYSWWRDITHPHALDKNGPG